MDFADLINPPTTPRTPAPIITTTTATPYGAAALRAEADRVATASNGTRNDTLNRAAFNLGQLILEGHLAQYEVEDALYHAATAAGLTPHEIKGTLGSAFKGSGNKRRTDVPDPEGPTPDVTIVDAATILGTPTAQPDLWDQRPVLDHIRRFALARMTSPAAVLGVTLLRALSTAPPTVVLPPLIGGVGSLNLFAALVGPSGAGKGASEAAARDAFYWPEPVYLATTGSGEGIAHCYAHIEKGEQVNDRRSVLFTVPEIDALSAISSRQGSTLLSQLRSAFSGERLGFSYADRSRRLLLERHAYRLGMIVGVQPERAAGLLADADGGTPQRFIWLPATDQAITHQPDTEPEPLHLPMPAWVVETETHTDGYNVIRIPDEVAYEVRLNHAARARGEGTALDGHSMFAREKVAFALAILDNRAYMNSDDWRISGLIMALSERTRSGIQSTLTVKAAQKQDAEVAAEIRRVSLMEDAAHAKAVLRVRANIERKLTAGPASKGDLRKGISSRDRDNFDEALETCVNLGTVRDASTLEESKYELGGAR